MNSEEFKRNWNIATKKEWTPCNNKIIAEYLDSNNVEDILPFLIKNNLRIVINLLFSGYTQGISTPTFQSSAPRSGLIDSDTLSTCLLNAPGESGGFPEDTNTKIKSEASSGSSEILPS